MTAAALVPPGDEPGPRKRRRRNAGTTQTQTETAPGGSLPVLTLRNAADSAEWLRQNLGAGRLSGMFARGGEVVHTARVGESGYVPPGTADDDGPVQVRRMGAPQLAARVQFSYDCRAIKTNRSTGAPIEHSAMFPLEAAKRVCDAGVDMLPALRSLRGVVHVPIPRVDGSLITEPGYDESSRLLYLPLDGLDLPPVPAVPTRAQRDQARDLLQHMICDFAFKSADDEANYLGLLLTPLLREMVPPPYKMIAIGAHNQGSGKSLLADVARIIHGGVFRSELPDNAEELRKSVTSILESTTGPVVTWDNVTGRLASSVLAGLLTSPTWSDRRLGVNEMITRSNDRLWTLTANNLTLDGDMVRRTVQITIDPAVPNPEQRRDFQISNLWAWAREHRGDLVAALLTLIRAWVAAGRPRRRRTGADIYQSWIETVDGILGHAGLPGTFDGRDAQRVTVGAGDEEWRDFLEAVHAQFGERPWTVKELLGLVQDVPARPIGDTFAEAEAARHPIPLDALPAELGERITRGRIGPFIIAKSLGRWLSNREGRWAGDQITVRRAGQSRDKVALWRIEHLGLTGYPVPVPVPTPPPDVEPPTTPPPVPAAAAPATSVESAPCSMCTQVGPSCGLAGIAETGEDLPCVLCAGLTLIRSRCGAARHAQCCPDPDADAPTPMPDPPPAAAGTVPETPGTAPHPPAEASRRSTNAAARSGAKSAMVDEFRAALAAGRPLMFLSALEGAFEPRRRVDGRMTRPFWRPELPGCTYAVHAVEAWGWQRPYEGPAVVLDRSAAFLSAASSVLVAHGALEHSGPLDTFDDRRPGYYQVPVHPWYETDLPHPLLHTEKRLTAWVTAPTVALLRDLEREGRWPGVAILDSYTADGVRIDEWARFVNTIRAEAITEYGRDSEQYAEVKDRYSMAFQLMLGSADDGGRRRWKCGAQRPDWTQTVRAQAAANLYRWADACRKVAPDSPPVALRNTDELVIPADALDVVTTAPRPGGLRPLVIDPDGIKLGSFKVKHLDEWKGGK